ncbi:MAG: HTH-type transcriptional regulator CysB [Candidatus Obscuribacterales bacterium]|nr:HTH-type transcriptional regulator CysB [Steroidobacteraceae bacterium]
MKLQQLRYLAAVAQNGLNITAAAEKLHTSQPAVSKQLKLLEDELGFNIFVRSGRTLTKITPPGQQVIDRAIKVLREVQNIKGISAELKGENNGVLSIGTTHTQARYVLPMVIQQFRAQYPDVRLQLHQGTSEQIAEMMELDRIDFAIATGAHDLFPGLVKVPCYHWNRQIVVPLDHPLASVKKPTLKQLAAYPLITYVFSFTGSSSLPLIFAKNDLTPNVALTAHDADVIKTYVRLGLGVGIVASMAIDPREDRDLAVVDASHLFPAHTTWIGFTRGGLLRRYMYDFMQMFAPHLSKRLVDRLAQAETPEAFDELFADVQLPTK